MLKPTLLSALFLPLFCADFIGTYTDRRFNNANPASNPPSTTIVIARAPDGTYTCDVTRSPPSPAQGKSATTLQLYRGVVTGDEITFVDPFGSTETFHFLKDKPNRLYRGSLAGHLKLIERQLDEKAFLHLGPKGYDRTQ